jgi:hypothetical protein
LLITFNLTTKEIENVLNLKGYFTRLFLLNLSHWLVIVNNRSEITILNYRQKLFHKVFETSLGLMHLKRLQEFNIRKIAILDKEGQLSFYRLDLESQSLILFHKFKLIQHQTIKDYLYIPSVRNDTLINF